MANILIRDAQASELASISNLIRRSKAHWGYDANFMTACTTELTVTVQDLTGSHLVVAEPSGQMAGMAQIGWTVHKADLKKLYVDPASMGCGIGRHLFDWCVSKARDHGLPRLLIEADPYAAPFYEHMGAQRCGTVPSGSIVGRVLPLLDYKL